MTLRDALCLAISGLRGGMMRTLLTILGLAVGVGAVLTVLAMGDAGEIRVEAEIAKLGVDKVWVRPADTLHILQAQDSTLLQSATGAPACAGAYTAAAVRFGETQTAAQIAGYDEAMSSVHAPKVLEGRSFLDSEFQQGSPVCLIEAALAEHLGEDILGQWLHVGNRRLRVVGIIKSMTIQTMSAGSGMLLIPLQTFVDTFGGDVAEITLCVQVGQDTDDVASAALTALGSGFRADTLKEEINAAREIVRIFVMVLVCVAAVCMLTGAIGVMNVLLISVRERRSEIGLMKAIGGTNAQLGLLFLLEAALYASIGGALGTLLGMQMTALFGRWIGLEAAIRFTQALPVLAATVFLGLFAGAAPAIKAASMQPVDALHSE